ncbi:hypothetical protein GCK72_020678 [Caenorhabditis remanei]|uniref:Acyltransferase 3 domain-containing protein n=1 Tax=Caenorhabditis remanei TaxID=31234 RepID=A0A6A5GG53_CAERE|nr:hypothetical protein GCK72_020678 [Caenorhabditis remanei]KAF1754120.1 hypothetical protein GCK72_020678 [Caenorhabditis remanei]
MTVSIVSKRRNPKRDDLQGIRGLAILSVLGFHFYPNYFPNGYLGVDHFVPLIFLIGQQFKESSRYGYYTVIATLSFIFHFFSSPTVSFNCVFARIWQFLIGMLTYFISNTQLVTCDKNESSEGEKVEVEEVEARLLEENQNEMKKEIEEEANLYSKYIVLAIMVFMILLPSEIPTEIARPVFTICTGVLIVLTVKDLVLSSRFLIYCGDISYSLYLIHWPIYAYVKLTYPNNFWILTAALFVSIMTSIVVFETFEKWYLRQSNKVVAVIIMSLFISNILYIHKDEIQKRMTKQEEVQL